MTRRDELAQRFSDQCREANPADTRTDDELKQGPFGGYATADAALAIERMEQAGCTGDEVDAAGRVYEAAAGLNPISV